MTAHRDVVIRVKTEQQKAKLEAPSVEAARAHTTEKKAVEESTKAKREYSRATTETRVRLEESTKSVQEFGIHSVRSMAGAGHGVIQLARGFALLSNAGEENTRKLLDNFVKIEAAVSLAKGAVNVGKFVATLHPVGRAIAIITGLAAAGAAAWKLYGSEEAQAAKATEEHNKALRESIDLGKKKLEGLQREAQHRAEIRGIDAERAGFATRGEQILELGAESGRRLAAEAAAAKREAGGRRTLKYFEDQGLGGAKGSQIIPDIVGSAQEQITLLRERQQIEEKIYRLRQEELADRERAASSAGAVNGLFPSTPGMGPSGANPQIAEIKRQSDDITHAYNESMRQILDAIKSNQRDIYNLNSEQRKIDAAANQK